MLGSIHSPPELHAAPASTSCEMAMLVKTNTAGESECRENICTTIASFLHI